MFLLGITPQVEASENKVTRVEAAPVITEEGIQMAAANPRTTRRNSVPCSSVPYANILADPVAKDWQPSPTEYKILALQEESCGQMKTGSGNWIRTRLRKGMAIAVPLSGKGDLLVVACGNNYVPEGSLVGKYFECPTMSCPEPVTNTVEVQGPERIVYRDREPEVRIERPRRKAWPWVVGGILVGGLIAALSGGDDEDDCPTCPTAPRIP